MYNAYKLDKYQTQISARVASYEFTNANKIYVSDQIKVRDCIPALFQDELEALNFKNDPEVARTAINSWVENRTHGMITDLLPGLIT